MSGALFLIPSYLSESNDSSFITPMVKEVIRNTKYFVVENVRTARRFISSLNLGLDISSLHFDVMDKKTSVESIGQLMTHINEGFDIGIISEAGLPGLADPGNLAVSWAHNHDVRVLTLPGTSSIQMALIGSGFNGQQFTFHGYLPIDKVLRIKKIRELSTEATRTSYTQLFMETPFRNNQLIATILGSCHGDQYFSIAADISGDKELIKTKKISEWKKDIPDLNKIPSIFSFGTYPS